MSCSNSTSPTSSLLQMNRPAQLPALPAIKSRSGSSSSSNSHIARTTSVKPTRRTASPTISTSSTSSQVETRDETNAVASASHGRAYLNMSVITTSMTSSSTDYAEADLSCPSSPSNYSGDSRNSLLAAQEGILGEAMHKSAWQPDSSSALCSFPLCTTNFGPADKYSSYFSLAPRRHHCRRCGLLFCGSHTAQRAPLSHIANDKRVVSNERVCDTCLPKPNEVPIASRSRRSSSWSENSQSTVPSDAVVTPDQSDCLISSIVLSQTASISRTSTRAKLDVSVEPIDELAPIEPWMGPQGILSLYPLAVNPSHAAKTERSNPCPAAAPLFAPSLSARRNAKEKEIERLSLRQRRMGSDKTFWIPGTWGYKREDFDPTYLDEDVEGPAQTEGGLVVDGPIRFRSQAKKITTPNRTPSEERTRMEWGNDSGFSRV